MIIDLPSALQEWLPCMADGDCSGLTLLQLVPSRPGDERQPILNRLRTFTPAALGKNVVSTTDGIALHAGLFQWHDYLTESHELAQSIEGEGRHQLGDYWHAIMHRREPDYANAKYWFRRVGRNPIFEPLHQRAGEIFGTLSLRVAERWHERLMSKADWDPFAFVDLCDVCAGDEESELALVARAIQQHEMALLIDLTYRQCFGVVR